MKSCIVTALRMKIKGGIGAAALTDLLQIDDCEQWIMRWEVRTGACMVLRCRSFCKQRERFLDDADTASTDIANYGVRLCWVML